jgi:hypothetical protein
VVKSCRKDCPTAEMLLEAKAAAPYLKTVLELTIKTIYKKREGEAGKRSAGKRIGKPIRSIEMI